MVQTSSPWKLVAAFVVLAAMAGGGFWWLKIHDYSIRLSIDEGINVLRDAGPLVFFSAMALLPAAGFPISVFNLTAASAFAAQMGMGGVIAAAGAALAVNLALTYWLARYGLRPWLEQMINRTKYKIPVVAAAEQSQITLLLRITPGPPFFLQSYLLGLAEIRFFTYMWISWVISIFYAAGFIVFGEAILHGKGKVAFLGLSALLALALIVHFLGNVMPIRDEPELALNDSGRVLSVTEFTREIKELLEDGLRPGWVRGEISNLRAQASGHVYFSLKDAGAQLACVLFRADAARQTVLLRDGLEVMAYGAVSVYESRGQYQLVVRALLDHGTGRLQLEFEQLKKRLAAEGLFDADRKKPIPPLPATIAFITSPTGAAVRDFISILQRRGWCGRLVVLPVKVQGAGASAEMVEMLRVAQALGIFDLLVIGRGGGSIEDLWAFNEEPLVRAVAACSIPMISAVGHEIDYTLCDFVADARAETPSGAAELISSNYLDWVGRAHQAKDTLGVILEDALERAEERLDHARSRLRLLSPVAAIEQNHLKLDDLANRLSSGLRAGVQLRRGILAVVSSRLGNASPARRVERESHHLLALWKRLESASPKSVLKRGYAIVRDADGKPVSRAKGLRPGQPLVNEFHDGQVKVRVE